MNPTASQTAGFPANNAIGATSSRARNGVDALERPESSPIAAAEKAEDKFVLQAKSDETVKSRAGFSHSGAALPPMIPVELATDDTKVVVELSSDEDANVHSSPSKKRRTASGDVRYHEQRISTRRQGLATSTNKSRGRGRRSDASSTTDASMSTRDSLPLEPTTPQKRRRRAAVSRTTSSFDDEDEEYDPLSEPKTPPSMGLRERRTPTPRSAKATAQARMAYLAKLSPMRYTATLLAGLNGFTDCTEEEVDRITEALDEVGYEI